MEAVKKKELCELFKAPGGNELNPSHMRTGVTVACTNFTCYLFPPDEQKKAGVLALQLSSQSDNSLHRLLPYNYG